MTWSMSSWRAPSSQQDLPGDQDVEVADGFASAAQRSGGGYFFHAGIVAEMLDDLLGLLFGRVEQEAAGDAAIVFDGLEQLLFLLLAHARKLANLSFPGQLLHAFEITHLVGAPDQSDGLRAQALDLEQVKHRGVIFLEQFGVQRKFALFEHFLHVHQHAFADAGDGEHFLGFVDQVGDLLGLGLDGFGGVAIRADAEGILRRRFPAGRRFRRECRRWLCCPLRSRLNKLGLQGKVGREDSLSPQRARAGCPRDSRRDAGRQSAPDNGRNPESAWRTEKLTMPW